MIVAPKLFNLEGGQEKVVPLLVTHRQWHFNDFFSLSLFAFCVCVLCLCAFLGGRRHVDVRQANQPTQG
jgi:hypothetical protein